MTFIYLFILTLTSFYLSKYFDLLIDNPQLNILGIIFHNLSVYLKATFNEHLSSMLSHTLFKEFVLELIKNK